MSEPYKAGRRAKYKADHDFVYQIHEYNLDIEMNQIYLMGEEVYANVDDYDEPGVEFVMASRFIRNLNICMRKNPDVPILIHMKTNGGFWEEGMAIYNAIKACPNPVTIINYTHARSMSSLIFQAANKRVMMPDSNFMYHEGTWGFAGTVKQANTEILELNKTGERMLDIYVENMKQKGKYSKWSTKRIREHLVSCMQKKEEVYLNPEETVESGLADMVFGEGGRYNWESLLEYSDEELER